MSSFNFTPSSFGTPSGSFSFGNNNNNNSNNNQALTTFGSSNNNNTSGNTFSFGLNNTASPSSSNTFGGFGNTSFGNNNTSNNSFGNNNNNNNSSNSFGGGTTFGNTNTSSFGNTSNFGSPSTFGNFSSNSNSNTTFGSNNNNNNNSFGGGAGGPYKPTEVKEGTGQPVSSYLHLCCMDSYKVLSPDMARWQEYKKLPGSTGGSSFGGGGSTFGQTNSAPSSSPFSFGASTTSTFGNTSTNTSSGSPFSFGAKPNTGTPSAFSFGQSSTSTTSTFGTTTSGFGNFATTSFGNNNNSNTSTSSFGNFGANTNSPTQFSFGNNNNNNNSNTGSTNTFSFGNNTSNTNTTPNSFSFGNTGTSNTTSGFGTFSSNASPSSFSFGNNNNTNKPAAFGSTQTPTAFSFGAPTTNSTTNSLFNGGFSANSANSNSAQPVKTELLMGAEDAYGKLPVVPLPASRTRPLPSPVVKPATPSSSAQNYKVTPKTMKRLMVMDSPASPAAVDNEQRVLNELLSPQTHMKKLVITEADQQNLSIYESARKHQKAVLKDLSNQKEQQSSNFTPPPTPYQAPRAKLNFSQQGPAKGDKPDDQTEATDQNNFRQSTKDPHSLSTSFKPTPIRVAPTGAFYQNPTYEGLVETTPSKSRDYNSYTEAVIDNRPDIEVDKSVPVPKCTRISVQTIPSMDLLLRMTKDELMSVDDFTILKEDVGKVTFIGQTDVRGLDLDRIVSFKDREIVIYPNERDKPAIGDGLNKEADITLFKCWPHDKVTNRPTEDPAEVEAFVKKLKRRCRKWHTTFKSYEHGNWTFTIDNFAY